MALDGTYGGLKESLAGWLDRDDLTARIPDFAIIGLAQINKLLRVSRMVTRSVAVISGEFVAVPADFVGPLSLKLSTGGYLNSVSVGDMADLKPLGVPLGTRPTSYAVVGDQFEFDADPADPVNATLVYYAKVPALTTDSSTNWLLTDHPDIYLYACLVQASPYLIDDPRAETWGALFVSGIESLNSQDLRKSYGARLSPQPSASDC